MVDANDELRKTIVQLTEKLKNFSASELEVKPDYVKQSKVADYVSAHSVDLKRKFNIDTSDIKFATTNKIASTMAINYASNTIYVNPDQVESEAQLVKNNLSNFGLPADTNYAHIDDYVLEHGALHESGHLFSFNTPLGAKVVKPFVDRGLKAFIEPVLEAAAQYIANAQMLESLPNDAEKANVYKQIISHQTQAPLIDSVYNELDKAYAHQGVLFLNQVHDGMLKVFLNHSIDQIKEHMPDFNMNLLQ